MLASSPTRSDDKILVGFLPQDFLSDGAASVDISEEMKPELTRHKLFILWFYQVDSAAFESGTESIRLLTEGYSISCGSSVLLLEGVQGGLQGNLTTSTRTGALLLPGETSTKRKW